MKKDTLRVFGISLLVTGALALAGTGAFAASAAVAAGSDAATPYTVDAEGIYLPPGAKFQNNGHVNIRYPAEGVGIQTGLHFEAKCIERTDAECAGPRHAAAQYIGKSFIPWTAFSPLAICVSWVQIDFYSEHYGEGGQPPVGPGCETPEPSPSPSTSTSPSPSPSPSETHPEPSPSPSDTITPTPEPSPSTSHTPEPSLSATTPVTPSPEPSESTSPEPSPTATVIAPAGSNPQGPVSAARTGMLPETGADAAYAAVLGSIGFATIGLGAIFLMRARRVD